MLGRLVRTGLRKGLLEGSRPWLVVGILAGALRIVHRLSRPDETVVFREELGEGTSLLISHGAAPAAK